MLQNSKMILSLPSFSRWTSPWRWWRIIQRLKQQTQPEEGKGREARVILQPGDRSLNEQKWAIRSWWPQLCFYIWNHIFTPVNTELPEEARASFINIIKLRFSPNFLLQHIMKISYGKLSQTQPNEPETIVGWKRKRRRNLNTVWGFK